MGRLSEAIECYDEVNRLVPGYGPAHLNKANLLVRLGRYKDASKEYRLAVRYDRREPQAYFGLGNTLLALQRYNESFRQYEKGLELDPHNAEEWKNAGEAAFRAKRYDSATGAYKRSLNICSNNPGIYYCVADSMRHQNRHREAVRYIREGLRSYPSDENLIALMQSVELQREITAKATH